MRTKLSIRVHTIIGKHIINNAPPLCDILDGNNTSPQTVHSYRVNGLYAQVWVGWCPVTPCGQLPSLLS